MNSKQIESIMTAKVMEYLTKGYILNTTTISGSQGEIAKVDLRKDGEIIRVLLTSNYEYEDNECYVVTLTVGRNIDKLHKSSPFDTFTTIWNNHLEIIEERKFYSIYSNVDNFTENPDDLIEQRNKKKARFIIRREYRKMNGRKDITSDATKAIVLPFVRRQPRCSRIKAIDITRIERTYDKQNKLYYTITLKNGKSYQLPHK